MPKPKTTLRLAPRDPIERHLLGRRTEGRVVVQQMVECQGVRGRHQGQLLDLSRKGALLTFLDPRFHAARDGDLIATAERLEAEFGKRITVRFTRRSVVLNGSLVRTTREPARGRTVVACAFDRALTVRECRLLGVEGSEKNQLP